MSLKSVLTPDPVGVPKNEEEPKTVVPVEPQEDPVDPPEEDAPIEETPPETELEVESELEAPNEDEPKPVEGETSRERALRQEVERLKREKREEVLVHREIPTLDVKIEEEEDESEETITRAEALVLNSMQDEAFEAFMAEHPIYRRDDKRWEAFLAEFNDRRSIMSVAKKQGKVVNKAMFKVRLESVHRSIFGGNDPDAEAKKRAFTSTRAAIALRQSQGGSPGTSQPKPVSLLPKPSGISTWVTKK